MRDTDVVAVVGVTGSATRGVPFIVSAIKAKIKEFDRDMRFVSCEIRCLSSYQTVLLIGHSYNLADTK